MRVTFSDIPKDPCATTENEGESETNEEASDVPGEASAEMEARRLKRDRRLKKKIGANREMRKKQFSIKCAKSK